MYMTECYLSIYVAFPSVSALCWPSSRVDCVVMILQHGVKRSPECEGTFGAGARDEPHRFYSPQHSQATLLCTASPGPATYK